jgi:hypothetical protein
MLANLWQDIAVVDSVIKAVVATDRSELSPKIHIIEERVGESLGRAEQGRRSIQGTCGRDGRIPERTITDVPARGDFE